MQVFHSVHAMHTANFGMQVASAYILIIFAAANYRLHAYYPLAIYLAVAAIAVKDIPVSGVQFYRK